MGFAHSEHGAVAAAGNYLTVLSRALTPGARFSWTEAVRALTVAPLTARMLGGTSASAMMERKLAQSGAAFFFRSWLLGYRVRSYSSALAQVALWNMGVMVSALGVVPPDYSTTTCVLRWTGGDWKVSDSRVSQGPTPPSSPAITVAQAAAFAAAAHQFASYTYVP